MTRLLAICVALLVGTVACTVAPPSEPPAGPRTPAPLPSGATALTLATAPPATQIPGNWACGGSTIEPARVLREGDAVVFDYLSGGRVDLVWPRGFSAWLLDGRAEIVAPDGSVVLSEGDVFSDIIGGVPNICEVNGVYYPPAS
jgi:hypothetical protein